MSAEVKNNNLHKLMATEGRLVRYSKGQVVQTSEKQKTFNLVKSGYVKRYLINNDGTLSADLIYGPGDVFSLTLIFKILFDKQILDSPEIYYFEAIGSTEIYCIDISLLGKKVEEEPVLYRDLFAEAGKRMTSITIGLENISMKNSYRRVAHQLAYYSRRFGHKTRAGTKILPTLTHQDLADILSLTRETVSVCMMKLRNKKLIRTGRQITVISIDKLTKEAFGDE